MCWVRLPSTVAIDRAGVADFLFGYEVMEFLRNGHSKSWNLISIYLWVTCYNLCNWVYCAGQNVHIIYI